MRHAGPPQRRLILPQPGDDLVVIHGFSLTVIPAKARTHRAAVGTVAAQERSVFLAGIFAGTPRKHPVSWFGGARFLVLACGCAGRRAERRSRVAQLPA